MIIWSIVSVVILILVLGLVLFLYNRYIREGDCFGNTRAAARTRAERKPESDDRLFYCCRAFVPGPDSRRIADGALHGRGDQFFRTAPWRKYFPMPCSGPGTCDSAIFWIATCFLAAGLFIGPFVGKEPKRQATLVVVLFAAVVAVMLGTLAGTWLSVRRIVGGAGYYFGHQGYEYIELGRVLADPPHRGNDHMAYPRAAGHTPGPEKRKGPRGAYPPAPLQCHRHTTLLHGGAHVWEGGAPLRRGILALVGGSFMGRRILRGIRDGGICLPADENRRGERKAGAYDGVPCRHPAPGERHRGHVSSCVLGGKPVPIMALGGVFSALEVVPLTLLGFEVARNMRASETAGPRYEYRWPVCFLHRRGLLEPCRGGRLGFLINPPIVLYYVRASTRPRSTPIPRSSACTVFWP